MKQKKLLLFLDLADTIRKVESLISKKEPPVNRFILLNKPDRLLNLDSLKKFIFKKWNPGGENAHLRLHPVCVKSALRMLYQSLFEKVEFPVYADIILITTNINLFYLDKGIRAKIFMPDGKRSLTEFKNEFAIRKEVEKFGRLLIPRLLDGNLKSEPYFFVDEIVVGEVLNWDHPKTLRMYRDIIRKMWTFYQENGITWNKLQEKGINIHEIIEDYKSLGRNSNYRFDFNLNKIELFDQKLIPSSLIHGDLGIDNIISTSEGNYLIDWELSRHDFIIHDFKKLLIVKEWGFYEDIDRLMCLEIERCFGGEKNPALSLSEQLLLVFFLDVYRAYKNPSDSSRLGRFEKQFKLLYAR